MSKTDISTDEAQVALDLTEKMQSAGYRHASPPRWLGAAVAASVASLFALYAMADPYPYIALPIIFVAIIVATARSNQSAYAKQFPVSKTGWYALAGIGIFLVLLFFGGIYIKRAYDLTWVPLVTGLIAGGAIFLLSESERRHYASKIDEGA